MKHPVGHAQNGVTVYVDLIHSDAAKHIAEQPHLLGLVAEGLRHITLHGEDINVEWDMGRAIGYDFVISTAETDSVFYAQLSRDSTYTRFIKNGAPLSTQRITLILHRSEDKNAYELQDAWIGRLSPPRPGSTNETTESRPYWEKHAFVLGSQSLQPRTVTKTCPYQLSET
jgi:hypothetical protein